MKYSELLKSKLNDIIVEVSMNPDFIRNPDSDFTRFRKLDFITTFNTILSMEGNSLDHEMLELFNFGALTPTSSAFVQARDKILPSAFSHVFNTFSSALKKPKKYNGFQLLAVDGTRLNTFRNPNDLESYVYNKKHKGHNNLVLSTMYDLLNNIYTDAIIQPNNHLDERGALIDMLPNIPNKSIIVMDRGYESYNIIAHFENINSNYVMRVKDISSNGILSGFELPDEAFDRTITVNVSNYQKNTLKSLPNFKFSPSVARFDFSNSENLICTLTFRVLRFRLESGKYQCIITNLFEDLSSNDIKHLYHLRWGIETSFRHLKYAVGLSNFHAKKKDSIIQEIFARLTLHNFCESIVQNAILLSRSSKHNYKINFTRAVQVCRKYLRFFNTIFFDVEALISKYLSVIRTNRSFVRTLQTKKFTSFCYRVS